MLIFKRNPKLICLVISLLLFGRIAATEADRSLTYDSLDLADGRKLVQVVIKNYDPDSGKVLLMAKRTAMKLPLDVFPAELRDRIKEAAPKAGGSTTTTASLPPPPPREKPAGPIAYAPPPRATFNAAAHKQAALNRAQNYYRYEFPAGSGAIRVTAANFELDDPEEVPGWGGRYRVQGKVFWNFSTAKDSVTVARPIVSKSKRSKNPAIRSRWLILPGNNHSDRDLLHHSARCTRVTFFTPGDRRIQTN